MIKNTALSLAENGSRDRKHKQHIFPRRAWLILLLLPQLTL